MPRSRKTHRRSWGQLSTIHPNAAGIDIGCSHEVLKNVAALRSRSSIASDKNQQNQTAAIKLCLAGGAIICALSKE